MSPPTRNAKTTDPSGTANPLAIRRKASGKRGPRPLPTVAGDAATGFPYRIWRPPSKKKGGRETSRPPMSKSLRRNVGGRRKRARLDLGLYAVDLGLNVGRQLEVVYRITCAVVRDVEGQRSSRELAVDDSLDRGVRRDVHLLEGAQDDR